MAADPRIVAFVCSWYPMAAADNAGVDRCRYSSATTIVPVDCAGSITAAAVLRAFTGKADGVLIAACGEGDCHFANGNESCEKVVAEVREIMRVAGLSPERLRFDLSSDVDGKRFASLVDAFAEDVARLNGTGAGETRARAKRTTARRKPSARRVAKKAAPKRKAGAKRAPSTRKAGAKRAPSTRKAAKKKTATKSRRAKSTRRK